LVLLLCTSLELHSISEEAMRFLERNCNKKPLKQRLSYLLKIELKLKWLDFQNVHVQTDYSTLPWECYVLSTGSRAIFFAVGTKQFAEVIVDGMGQWAAWLVPCLWKIKS
jgi:hypothetical protein